MQGWDFGKVWDLAGFGVSAGGNFGSFKSCSTDFEGLGKCLLAVKHKLSPDHC